MKQILHVISSIQGENSHSIHLGNAIIDKIKETYPGSELDELNLVENEIPHLTPEVHYSFFVPGDKRTERQQELVRLSDKLVKQLQEADIVVIGAPFYNLSIPSHLKAWIDHVTRAGITFAYGENGPIGMVQGKKVYVAMSSGGIYSEGPTQAYDFVAPYLTAFLGFLGMTDVTLVRAEGLKVPGVMETAMEHAIESIAID